MANTNTLEGWKCPECGNADKFRVEAQAIATITDNGIDDHGDMEWSADSYAECTDCGHSGIVEGFAGERQ